MLEFSPRVVFAFYSTQDISQNFDDTLPPWYLHME
jgi:hypothetical protein